MQSQSQSPVRSASATLVDLNAAVEAKQQKTEPFVPRSDDVTLAINNEAREQLARERSKADENAIKLSQLKKWSLLALLSLAFFIDIWAYR